MKEDKQKLKPIWLHCLKELFDEAEKKSQSYKNISALDIQHKAKKKFPGGNYMRFRAICYAMKSIFENGRDEEISGKFNSSTYTIKYILPRKKSIKIEPITNDKYKSNNSDRTGDIVQKDKEKREIKKPSEEEVQKYLNKWDKLENYVLQEKALDKLFIKTYPKNENIEDVLIKVCSLNDFYSTNIFSPFKVAKHIVKLGIDNYLENEKINIVNKIASVDVGSKEINFYSFATKYCSHHKPMIYSIYDYYVEKILCYFRKKDNFFQFRNDELKDYSSFRNVLEEFRKYYKLENYNLKEIDKYLWQLGKENFQRKY
jgi:hypothetical protein